MDLFSLAAGAAGVGGTYFLYLASSKGLPAVLAWAKARWNAGKPDLKSLQGDIVEAHRKIDLVRGGVSASFASCYAEIDEIKAKLGLPIATADAAAAAAPAQPTVHVWGLAAAGGDQAPPKPPAFLQEQS
jgi:hypothetical protein